MEDDECHTNEKDTNSVKNISKLNYFKFLLFKGTCSVCVHLKLSKTN